MVTARTWQIDLGLAADLAAALGWSPDQGAAALAVLLPERVPCGSTAKLAAMARGEVPPGSDADGLARAVLDHQLVWAGRPEGGAPSPAWSCWVFTTLMASLLDWGDLGPVQVVGLRRVDERAPVVDFHAAVAVGDGPSPLICDPYFGTAVELPAEPGTANSTVLGPATATAQRDPDGAWHLDAQLAEWSQSSRYRVVGPWLDRGDVRAFCAVSATHSGVPARSFARLHLDGRVATAVAHLDGSARAERLERGDDGQVVRTGEEHATWAEAVDAFARWTGVRII